MSVVLLISVLGFAPRGGKAYLANHTIALFTLEADSLTIVVDRDETAIVILLLS